MNDREFLNSICLTWKQIIRCMQPTRSQVNLYTINEWMNESSFAISFMFASFKSGPNNWYPKTMKKKKKKEKILWIHMIRHFLLLQLTMQSKAQIVESSSKKSCLFSKISRFSTISSLLQPNSVKNPQRYYNKHITRIN